MENGRASSASTTVVNAIPFRGAAARDRLGQPAGSTPIRLTRRGQVVRSTLIVAVILFAALVGGLFAGGVSGLV
ncbi:MAG TPA: hypothetical protein VGM14_08905 [Streptosporangiaceae bacterium]|jgi:hypothetical protein